MNVLVQGRNGILKHRPRRPRKPGKKLGQFAWTHEIACLSENELYVAELLNWRVQKLSLEATTHQGSLLVFACALVSG